MSVQQPRVFDPLPEPRQQPLVMDPVEEFLQVQVHDPLVPVVQMLLGRGDCRVTAPPRPETVAPVVEGRFVVRAEHLVHGLLYDPVDHVWNAKAALAASGFRYPHPANHPRLIPPRQAARASFQAVGRPGARAPLRSPASPARPRPCSSPPPRMPHLRFSSFATSSIVIAGGPCLLVRLRLRHRAIARAAWSAFAPALGPLRAFGCLEEQSQLASLFTGRGRLPSPRISARLGRAFDRLSVLRDHPTPLVSSPSRLSFLDGYRPQAEAQRPPRVRTRNFVPTPASLPLAVPTDMGFAAAGQLAPAVRSLA